MTEDSRKGERRTHHDDPTSADRRSGADRRIDFGHVAESHADIHARLLNWAMWCRSSGFASNVHPMFRDYRARDPGVPMARNQVDTLDAVRAQKAFMALPEKHRWTLNWSYCRPYIPVLRVREALGLTTPALFELLNDARSMMKNRLA